ncbi:MAG: SpoIIE family protein phosphatase, partial [Oscillospiraceae bacterium]
AVALSCVDISMEMINSQITQFVVTITLTIVGIMLVFLIGYFAFIKWSLLRPIEQLNLATKTITCGDMDALADFNLNVHTRDELENLADAFTHMAHTLHSYIINLTAVTAEKERIGAELDVAKHIQASMLPSIFPAFPERPELDIYATMTPAKEVGGDFYDFFLIDDDHLGVVMADVSGKGVPAALFMVIAKTLLKNVAQTGLSPKAVLEKVNKQLCAGNEAEMFVTVWLGILEISTGKLACGNAGHEYPVLKRVNGDYTLLKDKHGFVLAGMEHSRYTEYALQMNPGDRIFLYTDGVPEATNANDELYGTDRMLDTLNRSKECDCKRLLTAIKEDVDNFVGQAPQFDDITMLCLTLMPADTFGMQKLKLPPSLEAMTEVTNFVEQSMEEAALPMKLIAQMNIAVDEIFSNIARYSGATDATVGVKISNGCLTLRFADNGLPYDPTATAVPDTSLSADEREIGGLGLLMVKKFMDTVEYEYHDGLNILTLKKQIRESVD